MKLKSAVITALEAIWQAYPTMTYEDLLDALRQAEPPQLTIAPMLDELVHVAQSPRDEDSIPLVKQRIVARFDAYAEAVRVLRAGVDAATQWHSDTPTHVTELLLESYRQSIVLAPSVLPRLDTADLASRAHNGACAACGRYNVTVMRAEVDSRAGQSFESEFMCCMDCGEEYYTPEQSKRHSQLMQQYYAPKRDVK
jgi:hypothetical protein